MPLPQSAVAPSIAAEVGGIRRLGVVSLLTVKAAGRP
jgi:hypothetical protein